MKNKLTPIALAFTLCAHSAFGDAENPKNIPTENPKPFECLANDLNCVGLAHAWANTMGIPYQVKLKVPQGKDGPAREFIMCVFPKNLVPRTGPCTKIANNSGYNTITQFNHTPHTLG